MLKQIKRFLAAMFARGPSPKTNLHRQPFDLCMKAPAAPQAVRRSKHVHVPSSEGSEALQRHLAARGRVMAARMEAQVDVIQMSAYAGESRSSESHGSSCDHSTSNNHSSHGE